MKQNELLGEALLIYNPNAGGGVEDQAKQLQEELFDLGYEPVYRATKDESDLDQILASASGLVVAVGGDGTLRAVVTRLIDNPRPVALIPNGTANNVGRTLGIEGDPVDVVRRLRSPSVVSVDIGRVRYPWGKSYFLEGAGFGLYAEALSRYRPQDGKSFLRGCATLAELLADPPSRSVRYRLDGREYEGNFLIFEAMNMGAIGPRLTLAPNCDPHDGKLDLFRVDGRDSESYLRYLGALIDGRLEQLESVSVERVEKIELQWDGFPVHQDAGFVDFEGQDESFHEWVTIELLKGHLDFVLPAPVGHEFLEVEIPADEPVGIHRGIGRLATT